MRKYEVALVLHPDLEIDLEAPLARVDELFKAAGAKVLKRDEWGKRKLAYPIVNQAFGIYIFYSVEMDPAKLVKLERSFRLNEEVLRHLVIVQPEVQIEIDSDTKKTAASRPTTESKTKKTPAKS